MKAMTQGAAVPGTTVTTAEDGLADPITVEVRPEYSQD